MPNRPTIEESKARFDLFWKTYPRRNGKRIGKKDCWEWWLKNRPEVEVFAEIIAWLKTDTLKREAAQRANAFYAAAKDPLRWLKGYGWEDDIGEVGDVETAKAIKERCVVCKKPGHKRQGNKDAEDVWLCERCLLYFRASFISKDGLSNWGCLPESQIERYVQEGKAKLKH